MITFIQLSGILRLDLMLLRAFVVASMNEGPARGKISGGNKSLPGDFPVLACAKTASTSSIVNCVWVTLLALLRYIFSNLWVTSWKAARSGVIVLWDSLALNTLT